MQITNLRLVNHFAQSTHWEVVFGGDKLIQYLVGSRYLKIGQQKKKASKGVYKNMKASQSQKANQNSRPN